MKVKDYVTSEDFNYYPPGIGQSVIVIPAGTFVKPIEWTYLPKHIKDRDERFRQDINIYCYCRYGMIPINRSIIREK